MNDENVKPVDQSTLTEKNPENNFPSFVVTPDEKRLINETITSIKRIYEGSTITTIMTIGELIFEKIYGNDPNCFSHDRTALKKYSKKRYIFELLADKANEMAEKGECLPKKTFMYNAVRLVVNEKLLSDSPEYKQLSISHKIELLSIDDKDTKLEAVKEIQGQALSVREARKRVSAFQKKRAKKTSITYYINNPGKIGDESDFLGKIINAFSNREKKKTVIGDCEKKIAEINAMIAESQESVTKLQTLMEQLKEVKVSTKKPRKKKEAKK